MKLVITFCLLICTGCTTTKNQSTVSKVLPVVPPIPMINIAWDEAYSQTNEQTVIVENTNLSTSFWTIVFEGSTNQCWIPMTHNQAFFKAYNTNT